MVDGKTAGVIGECRVDAVARGEVTRRRLPGECYGDGYGRNKRKKALRSHDPKAKIMTANPAKKGES